ncbi:TetR/AcrR family transcriptional regulator [Spirosoma humi]
MDNKPKWNRRKEARPTEIIEAAMQVFIEQGFAAAKLDDVAKRAGIVKGTLYRYYDTKEDLFRAVVQFAVETHLQAIEQVASAFQGSLRELVPTLLIRAAEGMGQSHIPALARLVISESRSFPDLARIWHDNIVAKLLSLLTSLITEAQARGEVQSGDPKVHAFSIVGPIVMALLFHEVLGTASDHAPDLGTLARQHAETVLRGLMVAPADSSNP